MPEREASGQDDVQCPADSAYKCQEVAVVHSGGAILREHVEPGERYDGAGVRIDVGPRFEEERGCDRNEHKIEPGDHS